MTDNNSVTVGVVRIEVMLGDITRIPVDAIVNAANTALAGGGGVDGAIHSVGGPSLMQELRQFGGCPTGSAVVTGAGNLPAKFVFHTVGPIYSDGNHKEAEQLASCYRKALFLAEEYRCESISFPGISTGVYGYPKSEAAGIALTAIVEAIPTIRFVRLVKLVQFNEESELIYRERLAQLELQQSSAQTG